MKGANDGAPKAELSQHLHFAITVALSICLLSYLVVSIIIAIELLYFEIIISKLTKPINDLPIFRKWAVLSPFIALST